MIVVANAESKILYNYVPVGGKLFKIKSYTVPVYQFFFSMNFRCLRVRNSQKLNLFFNQNVNARTFKANFYESNNYKIGENLISDRLSVLSNQIPFEWLNLKIIPFKLKCKALFLDVTS